MKSFTCSNRNVNNYECVQYDSPKIIPDNYKSQNQLVMDSTNTADIYYQDNNDIYLEENPNQMDQILSASNLVQKTDEQPEYLELVNNQQSQPKVPYYTPKVT